MNTNNFSGRKRNCPNEEITAKFMNEDQFREAVNKHLLEEDLRKDKGEG